MDWETKGFVAFILMILFMAGFDSFLECKISGDFVMPFFIIIVVFPILKKMAGEELFQKSDWNLWFIGATVVSILVALFQGILAYSFDEILFISVGLWLTILVTVIDCWFKSVQQNDSKNIFQLIGSALRIAAILLCFVSLINNTKQLMMLYTLLMLLAAVSQIMRLKQYKE